MADRRLKTGLLLLVGLSTLLACQLDQYLPQSDDSSSSQEFVTLIPPTRRPTRVAQPVVTPTRTPIPIRIYALAQATANVRSAPSANASVIDKLNKGDALQVVGRTQASDWWQVALTNKPNQTGWISASLVTLNQPGASVPVVTFNAQGTPLPPTATAAPKPGTPTALPKPAPTIPSNQATPSSIAPPMVSTVQPHAPKPTVIPTWLVPFLTPHG